MDSLKQYRVPIALVAFVGLVVAAYFATRKPAPEPDSGPDLTVIRSVAKDRVDELEIRRPDEPAIKLAKRDGRWRVVSPVEADADQSAIDTALDRLADLEVRGVAATRRETHEELEINEAKGLRVIARGRGTVLTELVIGAYRNGKTLARRPQDATVYMLEGAIRYAFNKALKDWRDRGIVDVAVGDVVEVRFQNANGTFAFVKREDEWVVADGATAIERFQASKLSSIVSSIARLRATDFAESDVTAETAGVGATVTVGDGGVANVAVVTLRTRAGDAGPAREITVRIGNPRGEGDREFYATRQGTDTIFVISKYLADRLRPAMDAFQSAPDAGPRADGGAPPPPEDGEGEGEGEPGGAPQGIPPEIMRQLQKQLGARGGASPH
ncbi:MAG: DUF4340 domain-containing protein [Deltaproteobacteria bacterium]|nr:DUF4340 domain-containing protein [Deltaproteobacteria bacterium]